MFRYGFSNSPPRSGHSYWGSSPSYNNSGRRNGGGVFSSPQRSGTCVGGYENRVKSAIYARISNSPHFRWQWGAIDDLHRAHGSSWSSYEPPGGGEGWGGGSGRQNFGKDHTQSYVRRVDKTHNFCINVKIINNSIVDTIQLFVSKVVSEIMNTMSIDRELEEMYNHRECASVFVDNTVVYEITRSVVIVNEYENSIYFNTDMRIRIGE